MDGAGRGESLWMCGIGRSKHDRSRRLALVGQTVMHVKRCQQSKACVMALGVRMPHVRQSILFC